MDRNFRNLWCNFSAWVNFEVQLDKYKKNVKSTAVCLAKVIPTVLCNF